MSDQPEKPTAPKRRGRARAVVFYVSLAFNLLIVGLIVGAIAFGGRPSPRAALDGRAPMFRALTQEQRATLLETARATGQPRHERPVAAMRRTRDLLGMLRADSFDAAAFGGLLEAQDTALRARHETGRSALVDLVGQMSVEERRAYADRLEEKLRKSVRDHRGGRDKHGPERRRHDGPPRHDRD